MPNEITPQGYNKVRYQELRDEKSLDYQAELGQDIKTERSSIFGQLISIDTQAEDELSSLIQGLLTALDVRQATGVMLSRLASVFDTKRKAGSKTIAQVEVTTNKDLTLRSGFTVKNADGEPFKLITETEVKQGVSVIELQSEQFGEFETPAGTLTTISTPVFGVTGVTNINDATLGNNRETDSELRQRLLNGSSGKSQTIVGLNNAVSKVQGLVNFRVEENKTDNILPDGRLPHSVFIVADGGSIEDISKALIADGVPAGINYSLPTGVNGTVGSYNDPITNQAHLCEFARPIDITFAVSVSLAVKPTFDSGTLPAIRQAIIEYYDTINHIGGLIYSSELYCPITDNALNINSVASVSIGEKGTSLGQTYDLGHVGSISLEASDITIQLIET